MQKRRAVWRLGGDIRGEGADILLRLWESLRWPEIPDAEASQGVSTYSHPQIPLPTVFQGYQPVLSPLIGQIVNLCLSHHDSLRNNAVGILFGMIISEYQQFGHFDQIENELVKKLDSLFMSQSKGDDISRAFFIAQLRQLFESAQVDDPLRERVSTFLDCVDAFLKLLLSLRSLPEGEEFADDRVIATVCPSRSLANIFLTPLIAAVDELHSRDWPRRDVHQVCAPACQRTQNTTFVSYLPMLTTHQAHLQSQNYVEAALTLKLHSDLHEWDLYSFVPPMEDLGLPQQSQFHRKETLCLLILDYLGLSNRSQDNSDVDCQTIIGKGKAYESAIDICKELAKQHAEVTFN